MSQLTLRRAVTAWRFAHTDTPSDTPSLFALSMWIRGLFVGASMAVAGLISWFESGTQNTGMLALAGAGLLLAIASIVSTQDIVRKVSRSRPA